MRSVAAFTDTYLPTVNGVTYTVRTWRERWLVRGGRMDVVYPGSNGYEPEAGEYPVRSLPFPFYEGFRAGSPRIPEAVGDVDLVHAHTPFFLGLAALRLTRSEALPLVASYHTPTSEYAEYISDGVLSRVVEGSADRWERWFFDRTDLVLTPSEVTAEHVRGLGIETPVEAISNGVDTDFFAPASDEAVAAFRRTHDLPDGPLVGYTGRHGYEKRLHEILEAAEGLDATVVFGGDGPARAALESRASTLDVDARFLGFLAREDLPAFYTALDVFAFPSPIETQGLVALEANACGTPVVGVEAGALANTVEDGETGYHFPPGDRDAFRAGLERALADRAALSAACLARRPEMSVEHAVDRLQSLYDTVV
jgi:glycosyltransferase involved in cell wall biosynthesis